MARILITGAAGFIGSHLAEALLQAGHEVIGIDNFDPFYSRAIKQHNLDVLTARPGFSFHEMDVLDEDALESLPEGIGLVVHLAAKAGVRPSIDAPKAYLKVNLEGSQNVVQWMVRRGIGNLVFAGSSSVYGNNEKVPFSENDPVDHPISPYAYTKKACELMLHTWHHLYDLNVISLRFFTVYGPRQRPDLAIHKFVRLIREGKPITMYGDGSTSRDYTYIDDIVGGIRSAIDFLGNADDPVYEIINLGNHTPVRLSDLIDTLFRVAGGSVEVIRTDMQPGDVRRTYADISKAQRLLGYTPSTTFETGLKAFLDWYDEIHGR